MKRFIFILFFAMALTLLHFQTAALENKCVYLTKGMEILAGEMECYFTGSGAVSPGYEISFGK